VRRLPHHQSRGGQGQAGGRHHRLRQLAGRTGAVLYHASVRGAARVVVANLLEHHRGPFARPCRETRMKTTAAALLLFLPAGLFHSRMSPVGTFETCRLY
jgi:hypothetical protein